MPPDIAIPASAPRSLAGDGPSHAGLSGSARRFLTPLCLLLLPIVFFLGFFHWQILDIGNAGWLLRGTDNGENALGAHAYWHDPSAGIALRTQLLNAPEGVPVLYTDSNPIVALLAKPFTALLPPDAQLVGPFILLSLILQALFAWLLLRRHAPGPMALWAGVALLAFPPTLANRFMHANLMAHWTILAALWLFLDSQRRYRLRWWAPLIVVTAMIHSYLLVMVGAVWASAMLAQFAGGGHRARLAAIGQALAILPMVAIIARWLGVNAMRSTDSFGRFAMPIDALWNPGIANFSTLLPVRSDNGGYWFEGFQYLGAGGLLLVLGAAVLTWRSRPQVAERAEYRRLVWLLPALAVLALLAMLHGPLPAPVMALLDPMRASGRLFWPVGYVLVLAAIWAVYRLPAERAGLALLAIIAVQVADLANMAATVRAASADAVDGKLYAHTVDPRWDRLVARAQSVEFISSDVARDLQVFQEVSWRAVKLRRPVNTAYAARATSQTIERLAAERAAIERGALAPGRLYVVLSDVGLPGAAADAAGDRLMRIDSRLVIAPR